MSYTSDTVGRSDCVGCDADKNRFVRSCRDRYNWAHRGATESLITSLKSERPLSGRDFFPGSIWPKFRFFVKPSTLLLA